MKKREERPTDNNGIVLCMIFNLCWGDHPQGTQDGTVRVVARRNSNKSEIS